MWCVKVIFFLNDKLRLKWTILQTWRKQAPRVPRPTLIFNITQNVLVWCNVLVMWRQLPYFLEMMRPTWPSFLFEPVQCSQAMQLKATWGQFDSGSVSYGKIIPQGWALLLFYIGSSFWLLSSAVVIQAQHFNSHFNLFVKINLNTSLHLPLPATLAYWLFL